jgi:hypothetical protein
LPRKIDHGRGAAINFSPGCGDPHFAQQVRRGQIEEGLRARVLQGRKAKAARAEGAAEATGERRADAAVAVEENPAAGRAASFCISYF